MTKSIIEIVNQSTLDGDAAYVQFNSVYSDFLSLVDLYNEIKPEDIEVKELVKAMIVDESRMVQSQLVKLKIGIEIDRELFEQEYRKATEPCIVQLVKKDDK